MIKKQAIDTKKIQAVALVFFIMALWILARLFILQVVNHKYYVLFASNSHEMYEKIHPKRGTIFFQDTRSREVYPAAINKTYYLVFAVPKDIPVESVSSTFSSLINVLKIEDPEKRSLLASKLSVKSSQYAVVARKVAEEQMQEVKNLELPGVYFSKEEYRFYPENNMASNILGFTNFDDQGNLSGKYGVEGYANGVLSGKGGFLEGERGAFGSWITLAGRKVVASENGPDIILTIDRTLEYRACERLAEGLKDYKAKSASLVMVEPNTGAILAMCSLPDFDPNNYSKVKDISAFNNTTIFTPYEPGSVFKAVTMAVGLDLGLFTPQTLFTDPCVLVINGYKVRNAQNKCYGIKTMTQVLEQSINTGVVWAQKQIGAERFKDYVEKFGFGEKSGIDLSVEAPGDISSLNKKGEIFGANGSFGQGLTATPLQIAMAYAVMANGGKLQKPYAVAEKRFSDGKIERTEPITVEEVISPRAAKLVNGMLISVVENHYNAAKIPGFYVAGKTGTAQIPEKGKYSAERTNHTFAGYAPADDPKFVLVVKYEEPEKLWAEQTALPVFKDVMKFALDYYGIAGKR